MGIAEIIANRGRGPNAGDAFISGMERAKKNRLSAAAEARDEALFQQTSRANELKLKQSEQSIDRQNKLPDLARSAIGGDQGALRQLQVQSPDLYKSIRDGRLEQDSQKARQKLAFVATIEQSQNPNDTYLSIKPQMAQALGVDQSNLPPEITPLLLNQLKAQAVDENKFFDSLQPKGAGVQVNVGDQGEKLTFEQQLQRDAQKEGTKERAKGSAKRFNALFDTLAEQASAARDTEQSVRVQLSLPTQTGPGTDLADTARRGMIAIAQAVGASDLVQDQISRVSNVAQFRAIQESLVGSRLRAEPGVKTDGDASRMRSTLANINNPVEANRFISNTILADSIRKQEEEAFAIRQANNGETDTNKIRSDWNKYVRETPQFGINPDGGKHVFLHDFKEVMRKINPEATPGEILELWREKYGN